MSNIKKIIPVLAITSLVLVSMTGVVWGVWGEPGGIVPPPTGNKICPNTGSCNDQGMCSTALDIECNYTFFDFFTMLHKIVETARNWGTLLGVLLIAISGIRMLLSRGNEAQFTSAKNWITYVLIGVLLIWIAGFIVNLIFEIVNVQVNGVPFKWSEIFT